MVLLLSLLAFFLLLTGLVLIHEWGHYIVAKLSGVKVDEFGFGLPPRIKTLFRRKGTAFTLNAIPFGGFVRLNGEGEAAGGRAQPGTFPAAPLYAKAAILLAGVGMNFVLAVVLLTVGFWFGRWIPTYLTLDQMQAAADRGDIRLELAVVIEKTVEGGAAAQAGVPEGAILAKVDGTPVDQPDDVVALQEGKTQVRLDLLTGSGFTTASTVTVPVRDGKIGVVLQVMPRLLEAPQRSFFTAVGLAVREAAVVTEQTFLGIIHLVWSVLSRAHVPEGITSVVGIWDLTYTSVQQGFMVYLRLVALLSLSLAVLNVLPFPALDGGRLALVLLEATLNSPLLRRIGIVRRAMSSFSLFEQVANAIGLVLLLALILLVTVYDVLRHFA